MCEIVHIFLLNSYSVHLKSSSEVRTEWGFKCTNFFLKADSSYVFIFLSFFFSLSLTREKKEFCVFSSIFSHFIYLPLPLPHNFQWSFIICRSGMCSVIIWLYRNQYSKYVLLFVFMWSNMIKCLSIRMCFLFHIFLFLCV